MLQLLLFRHAEADRPAGLADFDRKLSARGRSEARQVGRRIAEAALAPDLVLVSPAARTRETWEIAVGAENAPTLRLEPSLYEAEADEVLDGLIRTLDPSLRSVMLVGHNPWLEELAQRMVSPSDQEGRAQLAHGLRTAALAVVELAATSWRDVAAGQGRLAHLILPA